MRTSLTRYLTFKTLLIFFGFLILLITVALYWPGLYGPFFLDDLQSIEPARLASFSWQKFIEVTLQNDTGPLGRPISIATFALNTYFFGPEPLSFKIVNLILHCTIVILLVVFLYELIRKLPTAKNLALTIALLTSTLWLIHPLQVSTVLYPVQRMTQLCTLFILLGLNSYLWGRIRLQEQKNYAVTLIALSVLLFYPLAMLSKENGAIFPWYLLCIEYFILRFDSATIKQTRFLKRFNIGLSLGVLIGGLAYFWYRLPTFLAMYAERNMSIFDRLLTQTKALIFYMRLILFPQISQMGLYHDDFSLSTQWDMQVILCTALLIVCLMLIIILRRRAPIIAFGLTWFFISHAIESSILPLELVFEHRNYLASVGLLLIVTYYFVTSVSKLDFKFKAMSGVGFTLIICLLMALTSVQSIIWSSSENFLKAANIFHPHSLRVHVEIANWLLSKELYDEAFAELDTAQSLQPYNAGISVHKILIHCHLTKVPPELYETASQKLQQGAINPYVILTLDTLVNNMFNKQCNSVDKKKIVELIQIANNNPFIWYKPMYQAVLYHLEAGVKLLEHDVKNTRILLNKSFETYPKRLEPLIQKAYIELQHGLYEDAKKTLDKVHQHTQSVRSPKDKVIMLENAFQHFYDSQNTSRK